MTDKRKSGRRRRLRLIPLVLGGYAAFLGFGLVIIGLSELGETVGAVRLVIGLAMAGFGLLGLWDGVRDVIRPEQCPKTEPERQFILTDTAGNRSSRVTPEILEAQLAELAETGESRKCFAVQPLPPMDVDAEGRLVQVLCVRPGTLLLVAAFETAEGEHRILQRPTEPEPALEWLKRLLAGAPDFTGWEQAELTAGQAGERQRPPADWYQRLHLYGESWHDEHKFFSARDVELAAEGICQGKYARALLELGTQAMELLPGAEDGLVVIWRTGNTPDGQTRFLAKRGTVTQVKFWLVNYLYGDAGSGWEDVTEQIQKRGKRWEKQHG